MKQYRIKLTCFIVGPDQIVDTWSDEELIEEISLQLQDQKVQIAIEAMYSPEEVAASIAKNQALLQNKLKEKTDQLQSVLRLVQADKMGDR